MDLGADVVSGYSLHIRDKCFVASVAFSGGATNSCADTAAPAKLNSFATWQVAGWHLVGLLLLSGSNATALLSKI